MVDKDDVEKFFMAKGNRKNVFQFASAIINGQDSLVHFVSHLMADPKKPDRVAAKIDGKNAFPSINRAAAVNDTVEAFPALHRYLHWLYKSIETRTMGPPISVV